MMFWLFKFNVSSVREETLTADAKNDEVVNQKHLALSPGGPWTFTKSKVKIAIGVKLTRLWTKYWSRSNLA